jgi:uncharacterized protein YycO
LNVGDILFCDVRPFFLNIWERINVSDYMSIWGYSNDHCAMYIGNNRFIEAAPYMYKPFKDEWRGVVISPFWKINLWATNISFAYVNCDQKIRDNAVEWAKKQLGSPYEWIFIGSGSDSSFGDDDKWFCSELIWASYAKNGFNIMVDRGYTTWDAIDVLSLRRADQVIWYENLKPIAKINGPSEGFVGEDLSFDAYDSHDQEDNEYLSKYTWNIENETSYFKEISHSFSQPGNYTVSLTVKDAGGKTDMDNFTVKIMARNREPLKPMIIGNHSGKVGQEMNFSFYGEDPDNDLIQYDVNWGDSMGVFSGFIDSGSYFNVSHNWSEPGYYNVEVEVSDGEFISSNSIEIEITFEDDNGPPPDEKGFNFAILILVIVGCIGVFFVFFIKKRYYF